MLKKILIGIASVLITIVALSILLSAFTVILKIAFILAEVAIGYFIGTLVYKWLTKTINENSRNKY